jgi:hypothetical protein
MKRTFILFVLAGASATAQQPGQPPIRQLGGVVAKSSTEWNNIVAVRALPGGRVLVNDVVGRKVLLLDSTLAPLTTVADTTAATATAYSGRVASLIPFRGDSSLFVDPQSISMMVIDPSGKITRVMSVPRSEDAAALGGILGNSAALDAQGRLVYRAPPRFFRPGGPPPRTAGSLPPMPTLPESLPILRVDLATRKVDTIGAVKIPKVNMQVTQDDKGNVRMLSEVNPLPVVDEWTVLSDGTVAFVRGRDYHVDFLNADGTLTSAPKIPFDWQRLTDEDKVAFIDSVKAARAKLLAANSANGPTPAGQPSGGPQPAGSPQTQRTVIQFGPDGGGVRSAGGTLGQPPQLAFVSPSDLPDYKPPFFAGAVRADWEGNLWVRTIPTRQIPGGPVYDVINHDGRLIDRVQIPAGRTIVGFGPDRSVYLVTRDASSMTLERARIK